MTKDGWLTTTELAKLCGVTTPTARRWVDEGKIPAARFGVTRRIRREDAEDYLKGNKEPPKEWLSPADIAAKIGVTDETVRNWIASGKIESVQFGARRKVRRDVVDLLVTNSKNTGN